MEKNVASDELPFYNLYVFINTLDLIIVLNMFFYILKMHAFQATIYYEKINAIYNSNSTLLDQEEEIMLEISYK